MYDELYAAWRREIEDAELGGLPPDFFVRVADYLKRIREEGRMLDKKTVKANLLEHELRHVKRMVGELVWARYKKLVKLVTASQKVPEGLLATEEARIFEGFLPFAEAYRSFARGLLQSQTVVVKVDMETSHKRVVLRFVKAVPAVIGADMKVYGPFAVEDVGSMPVENARILVKQGLAVAVEAF